MIPVSELEKKFTQAVRNISTIEEVESLRKEYLGKKGILDLLIKDLPNLPLSEKQKVGKELNQLKQKITSLLSDKKVECENKNLGESFKNRGEDTTVPSFPFWTGKSHPLVQVMDEITEIFVGMGFGVAEGPEVELDENNFGFLNIPEDHPARDMHDTFYVGSGASKSGGKGPGSKLLLRTHTSPVQIREMLKHHPPVRIIAPGKVYRHEAVDATHSPVFHQVEGLAVDRSVSFADLKGTLELFCRKFFGSEVRTRFRPSYFPFVEPGAEMDISCTICKGPDHSKNGSGCPVCKGTGWLEMLGAGMVHPNVFKSVGYPADEISGFAFGMGIERICMVRNGITDMRLFYENHLDFLNQF